MLAGEAALERTTSVKLADLVLGIVGFRLSILCFCAFSELFRCSELRNLFFERIILTLFDLENRSQLFSFQRLLLFYLWWLLKDCSIVDVIECVIAIVGHTRLVIRLNVELYLI